LVTKNWSLNNIFLVVWSLRSNKEILNFFLSYEAYAKDILKKNKMKDCNMVTMPMKLGMTLSRFEGRMNIIVNTTN